MRIHIVLRYVGFVSLINSIFLFLASLVSLLNSDAAFFPLLYGAVITLLLGLFPLIFVPATTFVTNNEGLIIVVASWLLSCLLGTIPYVLYGGEFTFSNAWFESVSGFTTTGSTILSDVEAIPAGLLFWRASTHWIGGMGIIVFVLSVLPSMGVAGLVLYRSEMSSLARENFRQNARTTLKVVLAIYVGLTALETVALLFCGMSFYDAVTHSFATIATGGFSPRNLSIAHYNSVTTEVVIMVFMVLSGIHFSLLFSAVFVRGKEIWKSTVVRYYLMALLLGIVLVSVDTYGAHYHSWTEALRYASFQLISVSTSTGFANADSSVWPSLAQVLLVLYSLQCACSGSTSGGIKVDRIVIFGKAVIKQIKMVLHPRGVIPIRMDGKAIHDDALAMSVLYISVYLAVVAFVAICLVALGVDMLSAFSGSVAATGNVGPGLGAVGSLENFGQIPAIGKWVLTGAMLLGRLEIYGLIVFFLPQVWEARSNP
jgi:trk system potassium uptake protein TrkH